MIFGKRKAEKINEGHHQEANTKEQEIRSRTNPPMIFCPFCNSYFHSLDVKFYFNLDNGRKVEYFGVKPGTRGEERMRKYCDEQGLDCKVIEIDGVPMKMALKISGTDISKFTSPVRVCANDQCNQILSNNAGFYEPGNGIFFTGLKGVGKTVMITTLIEVLKNRAGKFQAYLSAYNKTVTSEYENDYYKVMYEDGKLPNATVADNQLTFEWVSKRKNKMADITFSDIRGEDADNIQKILSGSIGGVVERSKAFVLAIDLPDLIEKADIKEKTTAIVRDVLGRAVLDKKEKKLLAVVITKSDTLANSKKFYSQIWNRGETVSPIYRQLDYDLAPFDLSDRDQINKELRILLAQHCPEFVMAAEDVFQKENINYFAVSALGCAPQEDCLGSRKPMPIRVEEPVLWLLQRMGLL